MTFDVDEFEGSSAIDLPVLDLSTAEYFLLVSIRHWVKAVKEQKKPIQTLRRGFNIAKVGAAIEDFHALMTITDNAATTALDVRYPTCAGYGDGEKDIISTIAFTQAGKSQWALQRLGSWLPPPEAWTAMPRAETLAKEMTKSNLVVPLRLEYIGRDLANASDDVAPLTPPRDNQTAE